ncbi:unnamed protein product [Notodromas monacha]|uniref:Ig-like domain-containing protein n=1 Tax=Notodromas monacha TaxID=399045 RepID=A0A7R9BBY2_9CRUS|nr:unnamed protein product [Notodromas monacha]CAG0912477.1 unnamed protein product [Notodromas monacha]
MAKRPGMRFTSATSLLFVIFVSFQFSDATREVSVDGNIPARPVRGDEVILECKYRIMVHQSPLYSVRWYKDNREFYSYLPSNSPAKKAFKVPGVRVDVPASNDSRVLLLPVDFSSSGTYKCEISTEGPFFFSGSYEQEMVVVATPKGPPEISGGRSTYRPGDYVHVNCTSGPSKPATEIMWYINGHRADGGYLIHYDPQMVEGGLEVSTLGLKFQASTRHFPDGTLNLKCTATMASVYYQSGEKKATAHGHHAMLSSISEISHIFAEYWQIPED